MFVAFVANYLKAKVSPSSGRQKGIPVECCSSTVDLESDHPVGTSYHYMVENSGFIVGLMRFYGDLLGFDEVYPLVNIIPPKT